MRVGGRKLSVMRIFSGAAVALWLAGSVGGAAAGDAVKYKSVDLAFEQGLGAYKSGYYEMAIPAFEQTIAEGSEFDRFFAEFYLARIYSGAGVLTDHAKAYRLYQTLANENADADPEDGRRAPFVAKALTALAGYLQRGLPDIGLRADPQRAVDYLHHAATFFGDKDAQFELAKIYLNGTGSADDAKRGMHYLSVLTEEGHPGAQAFLADLLWRGVHVKKDERRALALITMAVENAPAHERIWIEDIYQNIFCATSQKTRKQADGIAAIWRKMFAPNPEAPPQMALGAGDLQPRRACGNGELLDLQSTPLVAGKEVATSPPAAGSAPPKAIQGNPIGFGR
jgi:exopolysaccharide production negative regulator